MFKIKQIKPMFDGIVTTAERYREDKKTGLILNVREAKGAINLLQRVIAVGDACRGIKEGDIVKINFTRYMVSKQVPGKIEDNVQSHSLAMTYEIPSIELDGQQCLMLHSADIEFIVTDYEADDGGLLQ